MLYLDKILADTGFGSGVITIDIPIPQAIGYTSGFFGANQKVVEGGHKIIRGFCTDDVTLSLANKWGSVLPGIEGLTELSQWFGTGEVISYLAASQAAWKGSDPINVPVTFYLFSRKEKNGGNALKQVESLLELACILEDNTGLANDSQWKSNFMIRVHNGYRVQPFQGNTKYIDTRLKREEDFTVTVTLGSQLTIPNLLLSDIKVTHSTIQVAKGVPLYIKVDATFRSVGIPTVEEIRKMYGGA